MFVALASSCTLIPRCDWCVFDVVLGPPEAQQPDCEEGPAAAGADAWMESEDSDEDSDEDGGAGGDGSDGTAFVEAVATAAARGHRLSVATGRRRQVRRRLETLHKPCKQTCRFGCY